MRYTNKVVRIVSRDGQVLAKYSRCHGKKQKRYRPWYMLNKLKTKQKGFEFSNEFRSMPRELQVLYQKLFNQQADNFFTLLEIVRGFKRKTFKRIIKSLTEQTNILDLDTLIGSLLRC